MVNLNNIYEMYVLI